MHDRWYYGRGSDITGPVSGRELFDLAHAGTVILTDTIWQEGNETGVAAGTVKNLFPIALLVNDNAIPTFILNVSPEIEVAPPEINPIPRVEPKKARATAGKGVVLVGQDGKTVKYRMKCTVCNHEDPSWKSIAIPRGTHRTNFYCPKCRKKRDCEINGYW